MGHSLWPLNENSSSDTYGSRTTNADDQLRCNFPITLAISPSITSEELARKSLDTVFNKLLSGLGSVSFLLYFLTSFLSHKKLDAY